MSDASSCLLLATVGFTTMSLVLVGLVQGAPWSAVGPCGRVLGWVAGRALRIRRREVLERLAGASVDDPDRVADEMYASLGVGVFELLWAAAPGERALAGKVRLTALAERELSRCRGRGAIVATAHVGNWDLTACAAAERAPLVVVSKRLRVGIVDALWRGVRARRGVRVVYAAGAMRAAVDAARGGALVAMIVDQAPDRPRGAIARPFLGRLAWHDLAPAAAAARAGRPLVVALGRRLDDGSHEVDTPLVIDPPARPGSAWVTAATERVNEVVEDHVRRHPAQWLWLHRRWKPLPVAARRAE